MCTKCAPKTVPDHSHVPVTSDQTQLRKLQDDCATMAQTNPDQFPDDCARHMPSDQTIPKPKMLLFGPLSSRNLIGSRSKFKVNQIDIPVLK